MSYVISVEPTVEPILVEDAKSWIKVEYTASDEDIQRLIKSTRKTLEQKYDKAIAKQTIVESYDTWNCIDLTISPVQSISSIKYYNTNGDQKTLSTAVYGLINGSLWGRVFLKEGQSWPDKHNDYQIEITYVAGYKNDSIPDTWKQVIAQKVAEHFENRGEMAYQDIYQTERIIFYDTRVIV